MSAGLPGLGLSGVFFIVSALAMVPLEIARTARGRSSRTRWAAVLRNAAIALVMLAGTVLLYAALRLASSHFAHAGHVAHRRAHGQLDLPVVTALATLSFAFGVLALAKVAELLAKASGRSTHERRFSATPDGRPLDARSTL